MLKCSDSEMKIFAGFSEFQFEIEIILEIENFDLLATFENLILVFKDWNNQSINCCKKLKNRHQMSWILAFVFLIIILAIEKSKTKTINYFLRQKS